MTNLGRLINILSALLGTTIISLMILSLQNSLKFSDSENRAYETKEKLEIRRQIEQKANDFFKTSFSFLAAKNRYKKALRGANKSRSLISSLKIKVEEALYKKIETRKEFKKLIQ